MGDACADIHFQELVRVLEEAGIDWTALDRPADIMPELEDVKMLELLKYCPIFLPSDDVTTYWKKVVAKSALIAALASLAIQKGLHEVTKRALQEIVQASHNAAFTECAKRLGEQTTEKIFEAAYRAVTVLSPTGRVNVMGKGAGEILKACWNRALSEGAKVVVKEAGEEIVEGSLQSALSEGAKVVAKEAGEEIAGATSRVALTKVAKTSFVCGTVIELCSFSYSAICSAQEYRKGKISGNKFGQHIMKRAVAGGGSVAGSTIGGVLGTFIPVPVVGTIAGSVIGGVCGDFIGSKVGSGIGCKLFQ